MAPRKTAASATSAAAPSKTATKAKGTKKAAPEPAKKSSTKAAAAPKAKPGPKPGSKKTKPVEITEDVKANGVSPVEKVDKVEAPKKRKAAADEVATREPKKPRVVKAPVAKPKVVINHAPTQRLNVYVCGEGSSGELGLGAAKNVVDVKRPRLNPHLLADKVGVVQIATGGMHCVALTHDNKILTWGVNDQGALGRDTSWDGGFKDIKEGGGSDSDSDSDSDSGLNPRESTPAAVPSDSFPEDTVFVQVAASDSASFALTDVGTVYGWGTFRVSPKISFPFAVLFSMFNSLKPNQRVALGQRRYPGL